VDILVLRRWFCLASNKIAVEDTLTDVKQMLQEQGYTVVSTKNSSNVAAVVVSGMDNNLMNIQDIATKAPVIDASGKSPDEILSRIRRLRK
jgi:hypothetical protein